MNDGRRIECDVKDDGDNLKLVKKAYTLTVAKADVDRIEHNAFPSTQPATQPVP